MPPEKEVKQDTIFLSKLLATGSELVQNKNTTKSIRKRQTFENEYPHIVVLGYGNKTSIQWKCSGTLVSEDFVLTSAHCTKNQELGKVKFILFGRDRNDISKIRPVQEVFIPNSFNFKYYLDDIALLKLTKPVVFSINSLPACLYDPQSLRFTKLISNSHTNKKLVSFLEFEDLKNLDNCPPNIQNGFDISSHFCFGSSTLKSDCDILEGPGSPLTYLNNVYNVVGIKSVSEKCGSDSPKIYTRVSKFIGWIEDIVWA